MAKITSRSRSSSENARRAGRRIPPLYSCQCGGKRAPIGLRDGARTHLKHIEGAQAQYSLPSTDSAGAARQTKIKCKLVCLKTAPANIANRERAKEGDVSPANESFHATKWTFGANLQTAVSVSVSQSGRPHARTVTSTPPSAVTFSRLVLAATLHGATPGAQSLYDALIARTLSNVFNTRTVYDVYYTVCALQAQIKLGCPYTVTQFRQRSRAPIRT